MSRFIPFCKLELSLQKAFFNEFVVPAVLTCAVLALEDDSNTLLGTGMHALILELVKYGAVYGV